MRFEGAFLRLYGSLCLAFQLGLFGPLAVDEVMQRVIGRLILCKVF